jgi:hypothetical protein
MPLFISYHCISFSCYRKARGLAKARFHPSAEPPCRARSAVFHSVSLFAPIRTHNTPGVCPRIVGRPKDEVAGRVRGDCGGAHRVRTHAAELPGADGTARVQEQLPAGRIRLPRRRPRTAAGRRRPLDATLQRPQLFTTLARLCPGNAPRYK